MEYLDYFKYMGLLAELEKVKGTKKPLRAFVNRIYNLSNNFTISCRGERTPESARYCFMLASRALSYSTGNIIIKDPFIVNCLEDNFVTNNYFDLLEWIIVQKRKEDAIIL